MAAPRLLRPIKVDGGNYGGWNAYADEESFGRVMAAGRSSEGRLARRRRRRAALREKRAAFLERRREDKRALREMVRAAEVARAAAAGQEQQQTQTQTQAQQQAQTQQQQAGSAA